MNMRKKSFGFGKTILFPVAVVLFLASCYTRTPETVAPSKSNLSSSGVIVDTRQSLEPAAPLRDGLQDFGEPNLAKFIHKLDKLKRGDADAQNVHIVQLGDSHTASDTLTSGLRNNLQKEWGDAGIGWLAPMDVKGQAHARVKFSSKRWNLSRSRSDKRNDFPLGGFIATAQRSGAEITIASRQPDTGRYTARFLLRQPKGATALQLRNADGTSVSLASPKQGDGWQYVSVPVKLPMQIQAKSIPATEIGGIWLSRSDAKGVLVSPIGINGAQLSGWDKWEADWPSQLADSRADMVILAYGTNESFDNDLNLDEMKRRLRQSIALVRRALPDAVILIIGIPDALKASESPALSCDLRRTPMHEGVRRVQSRVAAEEKTLFWDWRAAMGGVCPALEWQSQGLFGKDLVHFTMAGYNESSKRFYSDLNRFLVRQR